MEIITWTLVAIVLSMLVWQYIRLKKKESYWKERDVGCIKLVRYLYSIIPIITNEPLQTTWFRIYNEYPNHKLVALESLKQTVFLARDPDFLQKILIKEFKYFVDHDKYKADRDSMINLGLFSLTGNEWRGFRAKLLPTFTTGKLKSMFDELEPCSDALTYNVEKSCNKPDYDIRDDLMTYAMDVTATVIFGIELKNEELRAKYKQISSQLFDSPPIKMYIVSVLSQFPRLAKLLSLKLLDQSKEAFFKDIIKQTFEQRKANNTNRNDYVQLLLKLKEQGKLEVKLKDPDDDYLNSDEFVVENVEVTDDILAAQAFQFLTAGFEPIYNTMLLMLNEVARCKDVQEKVRQEIEEVKAKTGGYNYKSVREMAYLEQCIKETLRKYPVIPFLIRYCVKDYVVNDLLTIKKGTKIIASLQGIQNDSAYFPDPEKFDPDRFGLNEQITNFTYLPFGEGPRVCIGMRFAMMEIKLGVAKIIEHFSISPGDKATYPIKLSNKSFFLAPTNGYLKMSKLTTSP